MATTFEHLPFALRWLVNTLRLEAARTSLASVDIGAVDPQIHRIRTALRRLNTIRTQVTAGRGALDAVATEASTLRDEIRDALRQIEDALPIPVDRDATLGHVTSTVGPAAD